MAGEAIGYARQSEDDPRTIVGLALPYGAVSNLANLDGMGTIGRETIRPGAARDSVGMWMDAQAKDGRRMPFRPRHKERPIGSVTMLRDTPEGVEFQAAIFNGPRGDEYLAELAGGINAVSAEFGPGRLPPIRTRDGLTVQRDVKLMGIAASDMPAYDGARIALRDMEDEAMADTQPEATVSSAVPAQSLAERDAAERQAAEAIVPRSTIVITRGEAIYGPNSEFSFLGDSWHAAKGDYAARERQDRHSQKLHEIAVGMERDAAYRMANPVFAERAGDLLQSEIPGALTTDYQPGLLTPRILKGRPMASFYNHFPISDSRPRTFAKVTTSGAVAVQSAEGAALTATDIATTAVTATPLMYGTYIDVSRQVLDSADPSALAMVYQDLLEGYAQASETVVKTAVEAGASASGTSITAATPYAGVIGNVIKHFATRFKGAQGAFIPSALFSVLLAQLDSSGRPLLPMLGPTNADGQVTADDLSLFTQILSAKAYLSYASTVNVCVFGRPSDYVIYESPIVQFQYDQVVGPQAVRVGLYAYLVVGTRLGSLSVTAA